MLTRVTSGLCLSLALLVGLAACGGGGGGGSSLQQTTPVNQTPPPAQPADKTGVVAIALKDAPSDDFLKILVVLTRVELLGNGAPVVLYDGVKEVDLLDLQSFYDMLAVSDKVPVGEYSKIRLLVSSITGIRVDDDGNEEQVPIETGGNGKIDLNPQGPFQVAADVAILIEIDMDAKKSVHVVGTGNNRYKFRPVVFVDIQERQLSKGLVRVHGIIGNIAYDRFFFELCEVEVRFETDTNGCVVVNVFGDDTSIFDVNGEPLDFMLLETEDEVTVLGFAVISEDPVSVDSNSDSDSSSDGDSDSGSDDDTDSGSDGSDSDSASDSDSNSDSDDDDTVRMVQIDALIIQVGPEGTASQLKGTALTAVEENTFDMEIAPAQGFTGDSVIKVLIQDGTKIYSMELLEKDADAIQPGVGIKAAGVLRLSDSEPDLLRAALILVDDSGEEKDALEGVIRSVEPDVQEFILSDDLNGDRCVRPEKDAAYVFVRITKDGFDSKRGTFDDLEPGQDAAVFGEEPGDGCFAADAVIVVRDERDEATPT